MCGDLDAYTDDVLVSAFGDVIESVADSSSIYMTVRCANADHRFVLSESFSIQLGIEEKKTLNPPLYELFLKNDELHDPGSLEWCQTRESVLPLIPQYGRPFLRC